MNLVIAAATGMSESDLKPFLMSFRKYVPDTMLFLLVLEDKPWFNAYRFISRIFVRPQRHITMDRNIIAHEMLEGGEMLRYQKFEKVLLTDTRDVIFQGDPFEEFLSYEIVAGLEERTIGGSYPNASWIRDLYGAQVMNAMLNESVSCSGVVIGAFDLVQRYLKAMSEEVKKCPEYMQHSGNLDQAMHNFLIYQLGFPMRLTPNREGVIATLAYESAENIVEIDNELLMVRGQIPAIVHQYDRWPNLRRIDETSRVHA